MFYDRKIKYVHLYEKGEKRQNVGFVKLEAIGDKVNICVRISGLRRANEEGYMLMVKGNDTESTLGNICLEDGKGCMEVKGIPTEEVAEGISYEDLQEIFLKVSVGTMLRCIIREHVAEVKDARVEETLAELPRELAEAELLREAFVEEKRMLEENVQKASVVVQEEEHAEKMDEAIEEEEPVIGRVRPQLIQKESTEIPMAADKWQQLWDLYPHMKPFEDEREYLMMKPQDFVILQNKYYPLSANSFLLHGYYNYEHLVLCRVTEREKDVFYIGVPGNFYEKEKQVAVLFGFGSFEGKREPAGSGDFGYYMIPVEI